MANAQKGLEHVTKQENNLLIYKSSIFKQFLIPSLNVILQQRRIEKEDSTIEIGYMIGLFRKSFSRLIENQKD